MRNTKLIGNREEPQFFELPFQHQSNERSHLKSEARKSNKIPTKMREKLKKQEQKWKDG